MGLNLYSKIEPFLDFEEEIYRLHNEFVGFVVSNELDNVLDIGCGQGYFLECLKANSKTAFGIDLSEHQIQVCHEKGLDNTACISLNEVKEKYDCATAIFDVINYINKDDLKQFFEDCYNLLNKDGYFIFDVNTLFGFEDIAQGCITIDLEDRFIAIDANYDDGKLITDLTLFTKETELYSKEQDSITQYYHDKQRVKNLLTKIGFKIESINDFYLHSFDEKPDKLIYICKK